MLDSIKFSRPNREAVTIENIQACCDQSELDEMSVADAIAKWYSVTDLGGYTVFVDHASVDPDDKYIVDLSGNASVLLAPKTKAAR